MGGGGEERGKKLDVVDRQGSFLGDERASARPPLGCIPLELRRVSGPGNGFWPCRLGWRRENSVGLWLRRSGGLLRLDVEMYRYRYTAR